MIQASKWALPTPDPAAAAQLAHQLGCPPAIASLLISRGIDSPASAQTFFNPSIDDLHDPMLMRGMKPAVERIQRAVLASEPILIYGDYDVDGTTATVLLKTAIERIAPKDHPAIVTYHVPHRIREGYGMQTGILGNAAANGVRLVISVDTGIRAFEAATEAKALGLDLIVTDHHLPDDAVGNPEALTVINPAQLGCPYPFKSLCGAAVAFKLAHAILLAATENQQQREALLHKTLPSFLKLVAIATFADSVPLEGENRVIASIGLRALANPIQPGLRALMQVAEIPINRPPTATEVSFRLAPRINAAGRMDIASEVVELFLTKDPLRASDLAAKLNRLNDDRRDTEAKALAAIEAQLASLRDATDTLPPQCIILDDPAWHRGVLGILASRVVDRTSRPALILTHDDGQAHGSGRSIPGFHLLDALTAVHTNPDGDSPHLFTRFGGHAHAVGFSLPTANIQLLRTRMHAYATSFLTGPLLAPSLNCDLEVPLRELTSTFFDWLLRCAPFGIGNPEPILVTRNLILAAPIRLIKDKHICLALQAPGEPGTMTALGWSRTNLDWPTRCAALNLRPNSRLDIAYRLKSKFNPRFPGLDLELIDIEPGT